jgi:hypothetical protein
MRQVRIALIALLVGGILAGCTARDRLSAAAGGTPAAAPTTTLEAADRQVGTAPAPDATTRAGGPTATTGSGGPTTAGPVATAVAYMHREVGMRDPVSSPFRQTGKDNGYVEVHPRGIGGGRLDTLVYLQRLTSGAWYVLATRTSSINVGEPWSQAKVSSPVRVAGRAQAFEGNVQVRVTQDRYGTDILLGSGNVTGGGDAMRPFAGRISFRQPTGGWGSLIFAERSAIDGDVLASTVVRVQLGATPRFPGIYEIRTWEQAYAMQDAVDDGHQPWRLSPTGVAGAWAEAVLLPGPARASVRRSNPHTVAVRDPSGTLIATVDLAQPVKRGFGGIWVITRVGRPNL